MTLRKYTMLLMLFLSCTIGIAQQKIKGKIVSESHPLGMAGVSVRIMETEHMTSTDDRGEFRIEGPKGPIRLKFSHIGYENQEIDLSYPFKDSLFLKLKESSGILEEISVSTGYQMLRKERATGSFYQVDSALLNRAVSTDVLDRLAGVVPGLIFNRVGTKSANQTNILIRGQSTIESRSDPLIVVDNFPFEGELNNINPNDIESITILKDAAAASIWGARAGNGVIVITTKHGKYNQKTRVSLIGNLTLGELPNLFYAKKINSTDFIDIEKSLFDQGFYDAKEQSDDHVTLSPVVELLVEKRDHPGNANSVDQQIEDLKRYDIRNELSKYFYRNSSAQQYALSVEGGSERQRYSITGGFDKNLNGLRGNGFDRVSLRASNTYSMLKKKVELSTSLYFTQSKTNIYYMDYKISSLYPYARFADDSGKPLTIARDYRPSFTHSAEELGLLNWDYVPLQEIGATDNVARQTDYRLNLGIKYKLSSYFDIDLLYQYGLNFNRQRDLQSLDTYYTRDLINQFTSINADGSPERAVPLGAVLDLLYGNKRTHNLRSQLNFNKTMGNHDINAIIGAEVSDAFYMANNSRLYGYDKEHASNTQVNYLTYYPSFVNPSFPINLIPNMDKESQLTDRFLSYYTNASYRYLDRYIVSASARFDQSNLFGVKANQKGVPLYSLGFSWLLNKEEFYDLGWLPFMKFRATYGKSGNVNKSLSAFTTARFVSSSAIGLHNARVKNPPNPQLRWEQVNIGNVAVDFATKNNRISGSIDFYIKNGKDLIGESPRAPQTGILNFKGNTANTKGHGWDISLRSENISTSLLWRSIFLFNYNSEKVTRYLSTSATASSYVDGPGLPVEGRPLYSIYSYKWEGLNSDNGNPRGYLNGETTEDYAKITSASTPSELVYHGSARPTLFGSFRNDFSYAGVSLSFNITYHLGYYFRRESVNFNSVMNGNGGHADYYKRWKRTGDENITDVPSMPSETNLNRNSFYTNSEVLVEKGDHIRLQDIRLSYDVLKNGRNKMVNALQLYVYANNLGILWKATDCDLDPDYPAFVHGYSYPPVRTISIGLKMNF